MTQFVSHIPMDVSAPNRPTRPHHIEIKEHHRQSDGNASFLRAARAGNLEKVLEYLKGSIDINTSNANGLNALHLASKEGHVGVVIELIKRGANVNAATKKGNTALHIASLAGQEEVAKILIRNGANVNVQSQNGFTPLYMAAQENHDGVVKFLLANGANQSLATEDGFTPLAVALQQGHDKVVAVLLENDAKGRVRLPALHIAAKKDDCKAAALLLQNDHDPDVTSKSGFTPLHIAAHYGNENIGSLLLEKNADVNYAAKHQITPLHVAAKWGKSNMVTLLLDKGAKIDASTRDGLTPLHCAARSGHDQVVDLLLERGAPITAKTKNGLAPLHMASQGDHVDSSRILLYHKAPVDDVTVDYLTALHVAAHCGHVRVAKLLLDRKADPNARALNGFTPLHIACKKNRIKVVELLLKHGASIEATTESGLTPLHVASFMGCMNIVIYLIQHNANPDVPTIRGETPLHLAARANQSDIIRILLRNGAHVDAAAREQQTPLHIAARLGNVDIVGLLLQHGAAVDSTTKDMYTALHIAAKEGQEEVASVLLDHGASLTSTTKKGFTPLHLAAKYGNIKVARLLLQKDAPVDAQGKNGVTPLHVAAHYDHVNVALLLLDKGAFPHATAKNGYTPLHIAAKKNQMDIATTLLEYGAKPSAESKAGFTPLHLASQEGHTDMTTLLIEHHADVNAAAKNGLTPLHLCAQEDRVNVAAILVKNGAAVDPPTKASYTPLHVACHFGQINMIRFLLQHGVDVNAVTSHGYTPLHQAAQQGHTLIINLLLEHKASPNTITNQGQTALSIAQRLGYISVVETLKIVTETVVTTTTTTVTEEKYKVVAPETMQETFMSDSEDEGAEDTMLGDQSFKYLTADEMKSLGDDSLPIDVTRDERGADSMLIAPPTADEEHLTPQHIIHQEMTFSSTMVTDNVDIARAPVHAGFLVSFMVDARGGAMRGCRHSGVRVIIPPRKASMPMRITCRYLRKEKLAHPPPLMEGEACASRILEVGPAGAKFLGPVIIEVPHFASLRGREREITILRSDNGETWREHIFEASEDAVHDVFNESFEGEDLTALDDLNTNRITRILTTDFPQYFAIITRVRQEVHAIGPEGGMVSSTVVPQVQAIFPEGALTKKIKVGLQAHPITPELVTKLLGNRVAVSPIVTVEPRRRKFHKPITLTIPVPQAATKGMINQYSGDAPTLRLLCSITGSTKTGGTTKAQWEDVTGSTPLTFVNDCVSFTTTVSARFWLMDCRQVNEATKFATELYREAIHVPFMAKFVVFAKRHDPLEAQLRVFCMTDDKEDKTLECQEHFTEVAKSRDVEVLEGKCQFLEFAGNLIPVTKSGEQLKLTFQAFRENRLPFIIRVKDPHQEPLGRVAFMREPRVGRGEPPQTPICNLNISLPEAETTPVSELVTLEKKYGFVEETGLAKPELIHRADLRLSDIAKELRGDWVPLALQLDIPESDINTIRSECPDDSSEQSLRMLRLWLQRAGNKATGNSLEKGLRKINREDIVNQCMFNVELVTDDVEKAVAKVHLDQSGFDTFKEELGSSRDASLRRETSLNGTFDERDIMKEAESAAETSSEGSDKEAHFAAETEAQRAEKESLEDALVDQMIITPDKRSLSEEGTATAINHHETSDAILSDTFSHGSSNQHFTQSSGQEEEMSDHTSATISSETAAEFEISSGEDKPQTETHVEKKEMPGCRNSLGVLRNTMKEDALRNHSLDERRNLQSSTLKELKNVSTSQKSARINESLFQTKKTMYPANPMEKSSIKKNSWHSTPKKVSFVSHSHTMSPVSRRKKNLVVRRCSWPPVSAVDQGNKRKRHLQYLKKKLDLSYFYKFSDEHSSQSSCDWLQMKDGPETYTEAPLANFDEFRELDIHCKLKNLLLSNIPSANTKWSNNIRYGQYGISNGDKCLKFYFIPKWHSVSHRKKSSKQNYFHKCEVPFKGVADIFKGKNGLPCHVASANIIDQQHYNIYPKIMSQELPHYVIDQTAGGEVGLICNTYGKIGGLHHSMAEKMQYRIQDSINECDVDPFYINNVSRYHGNIINGFSWDARNSSKNPSEISSVHMVNGKLSSVVNINNSQNNTGKWDIHSNIPENYSKNIFNPQGRTNPFGPPFNSPVRPNINTPVGNISSRPINPTTSSDKPSSRPGRGPGNPSGQASTNPTGQAGDNMHSTPVSNPVSNPSTNPVSGPTGNPTGGHPSVSSSKPGDSEKGTSKKAKDGSSSRPTDKERKKSAEKGDKTQDVDPHTSQSGVVAQTFLKSLLEQSKSDVESVSKPVPASVVGQAFLKTLAEQGCESSETLETKLPSSEHKSSTVPSAVVGQAFLKTLLQQSEENPNLVAKSEVSMEQSGSQIIPASVVGQAFLKTLAQQEQPVQKPSAEKEFQPLPSSVVGQAFLKSLLEQCSTAEGMDVKQKHEFPKEKLEQPVPSSVVGQAFLKTLLQQSESVRSAEATSEPTSEEAVTHRPVPAAVIGQTFLQTLISEGRDSSTVESEAKPKSGDTEPIPASIIGQTFLKSLMQQSESTSTASEPQKDTSQPIPSAVVGQAFLQTLMKQSESMKPEHEMQEKQPLPASVVGQAFLKTLLQESDPHKSGTERPVPAPVVGQAFLKSLMQQSELSGESDKKQESEAQQPVPASVVGQAFLKTLLQESEPVPHKGETERPIPAPVVGQSFLKSLLQQSELSGESGEQQESEAQQPIPAAVLGQAFLKTLLQESEPIPQRSEAERPIPAPVVGQSFLKSLLQQSESLSGESGEKQESEAQQPIPASVVGQAFLKTLLQESEPVPGKSETERPIPAPVVGQSFLKSLIQQSESSSGESDRRQESEAQQSIPASVVGQAFLKTLLQESEPVSQKSETERPVPAPVVGQTFLKTLLQESKSVSKEPEEKQESEAQQRIPASVIGQAFLKTLLQESEPVLHKSETERPIPAPVVGQSFLKSLLQQSESSEKPIKKQESEAQQAIPASVVGQAFLKTLAQQSSSESPKIPEKPSEKQTASTAQSSKPIPAAVVGQSFLKTLTEQGTDKPAEESQLPSVSASIIGQTFLKTLMQQQQPGEEAGESSSSAVPASVVGQAFLKMLTQQISQEGEGDSKPSCSSGHGCGEPVDPKDATVRKGCQGSQDGCEELKPQSIEQSSLPSSSEKDSVSSGTSPSTEWTETDELGSVRQVTQIRTETSIKLGGEGDEQADGDGHTTTTTTTRIVTTVTTQDDEGQQVAVEEGGDELRHSMEVILNEFMSEGSPASTQSEKHPE